MNIICDICKTAQPYAAMLTHDKWRTVIKYYHVPSSSIICMDCMEKGLQRPFELNDFSNCQLNMEWGIF